MNNMEEGGNGVLFQPTVDNMFKFVPASGPIFLSLADSNGQRLLGEDGFYYSLWPLQVPGDAVR